MYVVPADASIGQNTVKAVWRIGRLYQVGRIVLLEVQSFCTSAPLYLVLLQDDTLAGGSMRRRSAKLESTAVLPMCFKAEESLIYKHSGLLNSNEAQLMHNGIGPAASMLGPLDQAHPLQGLPVGW